MSESVQFVSEYEFRKDIEPLTKAVESKDMTPIVLFGEIGVGKSPVLKKVGGVLEAHYYGSSCKLNDIIKDALNRGFNQENNHRNIQYVFSVNDEKLFAEIKNSSLFRCYTMRRTNPSVLTSILQESC